MPVTNPPGTVFLALLGCRRVLLLDTWCGGRLPKAVPWTFFPQNPPQFDLIKLLWRCWSCWNHMAFPICNALFKHVLYMFHVHVWHVPPGGWVDQVTDRQAEDRSTPSVDVVRNFPKWPQFGVCNINNILYSIYLSNISTYMILLVTVTCNIDWADSCLIANQ